MTAYESIFSRFRGRITDPVFANLSMNQQNEIMCEWIRAVIGKPRIRRIFSRIKLNDELQEMDFELRNKVDEDSDNDYVVELIVLGMAIEWLNPQVESVLNTAPMVGGKEEKKIIDNHKYSIERLDDMKSELNAMIRDRGYLHNSYINGEKS